MKRGQVTVFVIVGIVLAIAIILMFTFRERIIQGVNEVGITGTLAMSSEAKQVQSDMTGCIKSLAETGVALMALQGGYTDLGNIPHTDTRSRISYLPYTGTAYMYYQGKNTVPTKETMEKQLAYFITENSMACQKQYPGLEVSYGNMSTSIKINEDNIQIKTNSIVKVKKEQKESSFNSLNTEVAVRLGKVRDVLNQIAEEQIKTSKSEICTSCITRIAAQNNMEINIDRIGEDIFYLVTDQKSKLGGNNFIFISANKF